MSALSISFTLGKASGSGGANIEHNNREFIASNVDSSRVSDNITYVKQDVHDAYDELFSVALETYNAKQTRNDRKIEDYYNHISEGKREEAFYEIIVQFGDSEVAPIGSHTGKLAQQMLDDYIREFQKRNPNLHIFNAVTHLDEISPHAHINFIPYYNAERKNGLSKGVSMRAALDEQGFSAKNYKANRLVAWEESEFKALEKILNRYGLQREIKNAAHAHLSVEGYKESQDEKKITATQNWNPNNAVEQLQQENALLKVENNKLESEKHSLWKSFYYSVPEKQSFVMAKLIELNIPFHESENGFNAQECYVEQIRKLEKEFKSKPNSYRDDLRNHLDKMIMQSQTYDEVLSRLQAADYEIKQAKYVAVKPKFGSGFIRLKSLGEDYSEQSIRNRLVMKQRYERDVDNKISSARNQDTLEVMTYKTIKHYTIVFVQGVLPVRRKDKRKPFCWTNDAELDRLANLNKRINAGETMASLRNEFAMLEKSVAEKESKIATLKTELDLFRDLYNRGEKCFKFMSEDESDLAFLAKHKVKAENYERITQLIDSNESELAELEKSLPIERVRLRDVSDTLTAFEKIAAGTYVQSVANEEKHRQQSEYIRNGVKRSD